MKADSDASGTYLMKNHANKLTNLQLTNDGPMVGTPTGLLIELDEKVNLPVQGLSDEATNAHVFPALTSASLLSMGQLCDNDCTAIFTKNDLKIFKNEKLVIKGVCNNKDGLWDVRTLRSKLCELPSISPRKILHLFTMVYSVAL